MSYYRARYYSPVLQRYISEDPIGFGGGDTNLYRYVGNNPHVGSDATGLCSIECNSSAFNESMDSVFFEGGAVSDRSPYRGYRPEGLPLPRAGGEPLVAAVPAALLIPVGVEALIFGLGVTVKLLRGGLFSTTGPGPQPALDGSVFSSEGQQAGEKFPKKVKEQAREENKLKNEGTVRCENCGVETVPGQKSQRGITPPSNETQIDHIFPRAEGGKGVIENAQILCRACNRAKSKRLP